MEWVEDFSDYVTIFTVRPYPSIGGGDNVWSDYCTSSSSSDHVHVRFCHSTIQSGIDEIVKETRNICLNVLESENQECCSFILSEGLCFWPIDANTVLDIAEKVIEKARNLRCNLLVDIHSVQEDQETYEDDNDDQDFGEATERYDLAVKSLKRKRIEYDGFCCVICLEDLTSGSDVAVMPCNHYSFHAGCLSSWLERSRSCPLCRRNFVSGQKF